MHWVARISSYDESHLKKRLESISLHKNNVCIVLCCAEMYTYESYKSFLRRGISNPIFFCILREKCCKCRRSRFGEGFRGAKAVLAFSAAPFFASSTYGGFSQGSDTGACVAKLDFCVRRVCSKRQPILNTARVDFFSFIRVLFGGYTP